MQVQHNRPNVAIFLDIDGVLGPSDFTQKTFREFIQEVTHLIGDRFHTIRCTRCTTCSMAQSNLFEKESVRSLEGLIDRVTKIANVHIVISSTWRKDRSVEELKGIFHVHEFSKYIVDKTVDHYLSVEECNEHCLKRHVEINQENYNRVWMTSDISVDDFTKKNSTCRASQINKWLKGHPVYSARIIFDDIDEDLSVNFGDHYISTDHQHEQILRPEDAEKAYESIMKQLDAIK